MNTTGCSVVSLRRRMIMKTTWAPHLLVIGSRAEGALAWARAQRDSLMGQLPAFAGLTLNRESVRVPHGLPAERTLALITFRSTQKDHIDGWIHGLNLKDDASISWLRMPVLNDPGSAEGRSAIENKLLRNYPAEAERARMLPVFTNRDNFVRSAGLNGTDQVYAVVINREGEVLARAEGLFDPGKAQNLRETLQTTRLLALHLRPPT